MATEQNANTPVEDNFYTPQNTDFYNVKPYEELNNSKREIRLLKFKARPQTTGASEMLELELLDKVALFEMTAPWYSLSYAAGDHSITEEVLVNSKPFNAFKSLATALRVIRDRSGDCAVWADQICINQSNPSERAYQVKRMREIYETATGIIAYLGEDPYDGLGINFLKTIKHEFPYLDPNNIVQTINEGAKWVAGRIKDSAHTRDWLAVRKILEVPWWNRVWICQESIVSRGGFILYGTSLIDIDIFTVTIDMTIGAVQSLVAELIDAKTCAPEGVSDKLYGIGEAIDNVDFILCQRKNWQESSFLDLKMLLRHSRNCGTGDARDRVYAFVGLVNPWYEITPTYRSPKDPRNKHEINDIVSDTYIDAAAQIIRAEKCLDIFFDAMESSRNIRLPSWVPDWSSPVENPSVSRFLRMKRSPRASADYPAEVAFPEETLQRFGGVLQIEVLFISKLSHQSTFGPAENGTNEEKWVSWRQKAGLIDYSGQPLPEETYVAGGTREEAFVAVVLLGGSINDDEDPNSQDSDPSARSCLQSVRRDMHFTYASKGGFSFFVSTKGYMGLTGSKAQYDDDLCIVFGGSVPFVLRKDANGYKLIGDAYVHGLMNGEAIGLETKIEKINII